MNAGLHRIAALVGVLALSACDTGPSARMIAMNQLVGQPEQALVQQLGVPSRSYETNGIRFLAYDEQRTEVLPPPPTAGPWWFNPFPPQVIQRWCETTFQVSGGIVRSFTLRGNACG